MVLKNAKINDPVTLKLLRTIPGIGKILSLVLLYEIDQIARFPEVGNFLSYSRLVRCEHESSGKKKALSVLEAKLGRAVYHVWSKQQAFDLRRFFA